jgi:hypothetical protein
MRGEAEMGSWTRVFIMVLAALLAQLAADTAAAQEQDLSRRLLSAAEGLQMPGSEADSSWWFVSYPGEEELPAAERMASLEGCAEYPEGVMRRLDFDATLDSLARVQPWMDQGQKKSAHGFARLRNLFHRQYGDDLAVYRCDTNKYGQVRIYFLGLTNNGLSGLKTINIET